MEGNLFNVFLKKILFYNLIMSIFFNCIVFLFHINIWGILFTLIPVIIKVVIWFGNDSIVNIEENEKLGLFITLCFFTLFFAIDSIIYHNFMPAAILLVIPILILTLKRERDLIKLECVVTLLIVILALIISNIVIPFKPNILTSLLLYILVFIELLLIIEKIIEETSTISAKSEFFMDKSKRDGMTGLYNSGAFYDAVAEKVQLMAPFCISIINIDNFKKVKDSFGQPFGDYVLKTLVETINNTCRNQYIAFRYGGEDVAIIFPKTTEDESFKTAEKIRKSFSEKVYDHNKEWGRTRKPITISIGLIESNKRGALPQELIEKCDQALFYSKQNGKNQTTIYHENIVEWEDKFDDFRRKYRNFESQKLY